MCSTSKGAGGYWQTIFCWVQHTKFRQKHSFSNFTCVWSPKMRNTTRQLGGTRVYLVTVLSMMLHVFWAHRSSYTMASYTKSIIVKCRYVSQYTTDNNTKIHIYIYVLQGRSDCTYLPTQISVRSTKCLSANSAITRLPASGHCDLGDLHF